MMMMIVVVDCGDDNGARNDDYKEEDDDDHIYFSSSQLQVGAQEANHCKGKTIFVTGALTTTRWRTGCWRKPWQGNMWGYIWLIVEPWIGWQSSTAG